VTIEQQVMMDATGMPFATLMKQLVLDRISMKDSTYEQPLPVAWAARTATGTYTDGKPVRGRWHVYPEMAAAGLWTTPTDLAKFAIEIALSKHGRSNKVLSQRAVQEMVTAQPNTDDSGIGFGLPTQQPGVFAHNGANLSKKVAAQEKEIIEAVLRKCQGRVSGPSGAAAKLGIARSTESKIRSLKINKNRFRA